MIYVALCTRSSQLVTESKLKVGMRIKDGMMNFKQFTTVVDSVHYCCGLVEGEIDDCSEAGVLTRELSFAILEWRVSQFPYSHPQAMYMQLVVFMSST